MIGVGIIGIVGSLVLLVKVVLKPSDRVNDQAIYSDNRNVVENNQEVTVEETKQIDETTIMENTDLPTTVAYEISDEATALLERKEIKQAPKSTVLLLDKEEEGSSEKTYENVKENVNPVASTVLLKSEDK
ncbi:MAG: hypothetical protein LPK26_12950 [Bacillaceae bacterium]|nr:hypothetical protein [Bacillaceae bacterium]